MESKCKELVVVAMDFGTTFSGYAYSFKSEYDNDPGKISCNTKWTSGTNNYGSLKTPTTILIKYNGRMKAPVYHGFGYIAQDKYTKLVEDDDHEDYFLIDRFKMKLYSEAAVSELNKGTTIQLGKGYDVKAIDLISKFIMFLKDHFWNAITKRQLALEEKDVRWIITVPAIWTDGAKQFMREAAEMAGISSSKLTIVYEPEAAALCCVHLQDPSQKEKTAVLKTGTKCIVVDAGGGTVDYTVHEVTDTKQLVVKHKASGGPWGGTTVDESFIGMFKEIFGDDVYTKFVEDNREDFITLYREFEFKKRNIQEDDERVTFRFPASLTSVYEEMKGKPIKSAMSEKYSSEVEIIKDKLRVKADTIRRLFKNSSKHIVAHTKKLLNKEEGKDTTTLLLVGGFMSSDILQKEMKKNFPNLNLITPEDPELAVVKGAVLFGHNPDVVKIRVARFTYGIDINKIFDPEIHPEHKKIERDGIDLCTDLFDIHVKKGQTLQVGKPEQKQTYKPVEATQTTIPFLIYVSTEKNPMFVTDPSCSFIGKMTIDMPDTSGGRDRKMVAQMSFGETEITVEATEVKTGKVVQANFNFLG